MAGLIDPFAPSQTPAPVDVDRLRRESLARMNTMATGGLAGLVPQAPTQPAAPRAPQLLFNPITNEMSAGGRTFAADDIKSVLSVPQFLEAPQGPEPEGPDWRVMTPGEYADRARTFSERRGTGELLGRGVKNLAYGLGTLPGTLTSLVGFEETGAALRAPVEALLGDSENEQLRSALIAENSTLWEQVKDAGIESIPMLIGSLAGGMGAASWASRAGKAASTVARAGTTGAAVVNFPVHLAGMYDAAVRNQADLTSLETKSEILGGALLNSYLDTWGIESRLLSPAAKAAMGSAATNTIRRRLAAGAMTGLAEGVAEVGQTAVETLMFDPTVRETLSAGDLKALSTHVAKQYGESYAVSFLAGAGLGAMVGAGLPPGALDRTAPPKKTPVDPNKPLDLNTKAAEQAAAKEQPAAGEAQPAGPLAIPYVPGSQTIGAVPVAPTGAEQIADPNRPLTLQQVGLMRGMTGGLRPEDRAAGNITVPTGDRNIALEGEILPPETVAAAPQAARLRALGGPGVAPQLEAPPAIAKDFTAGPEGVAPAGAPPVVEPAAAPVTPGAQLRVGMAPRPQLLTGQTTDTAMGNQLQAIMAASDQAKQAAQQQADLATQQQREAKTAAAQRTAQVEEAYAQREAQRATMYTAEQQAAYDQLTAEQKAYVDADTAWEGFRPQDGKKQSGVTLRDLTKKAQQDWVTAVQQGTADQALYTQLRGRRQVGKAAPLMDVPTILRPTPAPAPAAAATAPKRTPAQMVEAARERARAVALKEARAANKAVAVAGKPYKDFNDPVGSPMHEVALPDGSIVRISRTDNGMGISGWFDVETGRYLADTKSEAVVRLGQPFQTPPPTGGRGGKKPRTGTREDTVKKGKGAESKPNAAPGAKAEADAAAKAKAEADAAAKAKADAEAAAKAEADAKAKTQTPAEPPATVTAKEPTRVTKAKSGLDFDYYVVELSDGRAVEVRSKDGKWVFRADESVVEGEKLTSKTVGDAVAKMASEGKLPDALVGKSVFAEPKPKVTAKTATEAEETAALTKEELPEYERDLGGKDDPLVGDRLNAAKGLLTIINDGSLPEDIRAAATDIYNKGTTAKQRAAVEASLAKERSSARGTKKTAEKVDMPKPVADLIALIRAYNYRDPGVGNAFSQGNTFAALAREVADKHPNAVYDGRPLKSYIGEGSKPVFVERDGVRYIGAAPVSGSFALADFNTLVGATGYDGKPVTPLPVGRVDLMVRTYLGKLARPPKVTVARNQADLKTRNPRLYARAKAARGNDDFDTADAMGYSFGDGEVIVFTDRIATEQQLNFVLAHESMGHYGLRAIMPASKYEGTMDAVYNSSPVIKATVDMAVEVRGMSRAEATEEYLADYAAVLDMSVLRRVAAAMKNALNAIGFKFSDDMVRHLVRTARRYVRNGKRDNLFTASRVFRDIHDIESGVDSLATGRFKQGFKSDNLRTDLVAYDVFGGPPRSVEQVTAAFKEVSSGLSAKTEKFVNKFFSLTAFRARENAGMAEGVRIVNRAGEETTKHRNSADELMRDALNQEVRILGVKLSDGITETEQLAASYLMYTQQDNVRGKVDAKVDAVVKKLRDAKKPTRMFSIVGEEVIPTGAAEAYIKAGRLSPEQAVEVLSKDSRYKGVAAEIAKAIETDTLKDNRAWMAYDNVRQAFEETELGLIEAQYKALIEDQKNAQLSMLEMLPDPGPGKEKTLLPQDKAMFNTWAEFYYALYAGGAVTVEDNLVTTDTGKKAAERFSKAVNEVILAKGFDTQKEEAIREFFKGKQVDDFIEQLVDFRKRITRNPQTDFAVQNAIASFADAELSNTSAELSARKMLVQGFTPIVRKQQDFQVRVNAFDAKTGQYIQMDNEYKGLAVYRTAGTLEEATTLANRFTGIFSDTENIPEGATDVETAEVDGKPVRIYTIKGRAKGDLDSKEYKVIIRAEASAAVTGVTTPLNLNIHEFMRGLRQYGLNLTPAKMEQIVIDMTAQDAKARKRLEQTGNPGYQVEGGVNALEAIAQHIDGRASLIAKILMRPQIDRLMNVKLASSQKLWYGDKEKLNNLKDAYDKAVANPNASEAEVFLAKAEYDDYAYKMKNTITVNNGVEVNLGNKYLSDMQSLMAFVNGNRDVNESDWGSGPVASWFRRWISSYQLGGTLTQPIMNNIGPFTNFIPWLASFNSKNGFGGGAGMKNAYTHYIRAMSDVGSAGGVSFTKQAVEMHTAKYWDEVATGLREHPGVTQVEAQFIADETLRGILTPAQANSLLGASRNYTKNPMLRKALDKWMFFYISSEQATRRAAALAAFRVEMNRQLAAKGVPFEKLSPGEQKLVKAKATRFAVDGVQLTLGDYNVTNRPAAWRSGLQSFLYMYRVWQTTSIQTFTRLDPMGKALFLAPLLIMSGLAGLPFAEDIEDLLDTFLQWTGMGKGSIRLELAKALDSIFPGQSAYILNGPMSAILGLDTAGKFSLGDFVPGSAALLPGQDPFQTFKEIAGPAWGFLEGTVKGGYQLAAAPFSDTATVVDAMREGPITLFRALGDTLAYSSAGAVIDKRGYVIEDDLTTAMLAIRTLGFTPAPVAAQYEVIRLAKRETNYQKQMVAGWRTQLLKAEMSGDTVTAASIRRAVREWNEVHKGTLLEIKNFEKNYQRMKQQGTKPALDRYMQSVGKQNQDAVELLDYLIGYD